VSCHRVTRKHDRTDGNGTDWTRNYFEEVMGNMCLVHLRLVAHG